ncbi:hypothetical protein CYCD_29760 [Tenuifilaceae bacterium CYCD]|nr:hypothetical protein CYCD_29760 [Tenuifilaceae bacterium CYCD]
MAKNKFYLRDQFIEWMSNEGFSSGSSYSSYISSFFEEYKLMTLEESQFEALIDSGDIEELNDVFSGFYTIINSEKCSEKPKMSIKELRDSSSALRKYHYFLSELIQNSKSSLNQFVTIEEEIEELQNEELLPLENVKEVLITGDEIKTNFTIRLLTQDRFYGDVFFPISLIKKICYKNLARKEFDLWIDNQIDKIKFITNKDIVYIKDIETLKINKIGEVHLVCKDNSNHILHTKYASNSNTTPMYVKSFRQVVIDHEVPMKELLTKHKENLNTLESLTVELKKIHGKKFLVRNDLVSAGNQFINSHSFNVNEINHLITDLNYINKFIVLQIMESKQNSIKRAKN